MTREDNWEDRLRFHKDRAARCVTMVRGDS